MYVLCFWRAWNLMAISREVKLRLWLHPTVSELRLFRGVILSASKSDWRFRVPQVAHWQRLILIKLQGYQGSILFLWESCWGKRCVRLDSSKIMGRGSHFGKSTVFPVEPISVAYNNNTLQKKLVTNWLQKRKKGKGKDRPQEIGRLDEWFHIYRTTGNCLVSTFFLSNWD